MNKLKVKKAKIKYSADTLLVGGGTVGVFTVISAVKSGAKTILIEKNGILGGTMTVGGAAVSENDANLDELSRKLHLIYTN